MEKTAAKILEFNLAFQEKMYEICGNRIDFYRIGEDYGSQQGLLFSPELWKEFVRPNIEAGVDVIDPLQALASGMNLENLKRIFPSRI